MRMNIRRRLLSLALALLALFAMTEGEGGLVPPARAVTQAEIDSLKGDAKELASQSSSLKSQLAELKNERNSAIKQKNLVDQQITLTVQAIENTEKQISGFETMLVQTEYELEENRRQEEEQYAVFCERARVMEEAGTTSYWAVLFKAESFSDLLSRLSDIQEVMNYDQSVLDALRQLRAEIEEKQQLQEDLMAQSEAAKAELEAAKAELEAHKAELDTQRAEAERLIQEIQDNVDEYQSQLDELNAERDRIQQEIVKKSNELAAQMAMTATKGGYIWPETVSRRITSPMGSRNTGIPGASTNHKGVDIGGVGYTTNVLATKAGVVIVSKLSSSYGNYVVISHGPGNTTLYAHMSSRAVKEGDSVTQGQVIGVTGNTGISRGAHLHYEITEGGVRVNPLDYLPGYVQAW